MRRSLARGRRGRALVAAGVLLALASARTAWAQPPADAAAHAAPLAPTAPTEARIEAVKRLGASGDSRALEPLVGALKDANRDVRWAAVEALGDLGDRRAVPALLEFLKRAEAYRWGKRLVANALGALGDPAGVDALLELLGDEDPFVRRLAGLALLQIGDPRALPRVAKLAAQAADETLGTVRRELARAEQDVGRRRAAAATARPAETPATFKAREWAGLRVGTASFAHARERLGTPLQATPEFLLFGGEQARGPLRAESLVVNGSREGLIESIFVFPAWGTLDRDVRAVLGTGKVMSYGEFLRSTGRSASGAGTRAAEKLHYLPQNLVTESYGDLGVLVIYDGAEATAQDRQVKLLIVY